MNIPDKAVEAAVLALREEGSETPRIDTLAALDAAAPFIAAQAWDEGYDAGCHDGADDQHGYAMTRTNPYKATP